MGITTAFGEFQRTGVRIGIATDIVGTANPTLELRNSEMADAGGKREVTSFDVSAGGLPLKAASDYTVGRDQPNFSIRTGFAADVWTYTMLSLCQKTNWTTLDDVYRMAMWDFSGIVDSASGVTSQGGFMTIETGITSGAGVGGVDRAVGCVCTSMTVNIPTSGTDGGRPDLTSEWIGADSTRADAFTGSPTVSTATNQLSTAFDFEVDGTAMSLVDFSFTLSNNAAMSPNIGLTPDSVFLGEMVGSGNLSIVKDNTATTGYWDLLMTKMEAGTVARITVRNEDMFAGTVDTYALIDIDVILKAPDKGGATNNAAVVNFPFDLVYSNSARPIFDAPSADLTWPGQTGD